MDLISLIVRGDDFGLCHAANQAVWEAFETGLLTCASLAVTGPWWAEAVALARDHPEWEIGWQLGLRCPTSGCRWGPVAGATTVPSLVDATGALAAVLPATADPDEITRELEAQIEKAGRWGLQPAYLEYDGDPHPVVDQQLQRLSERLGAPAHMTAWAIQRVSLPVAPGTTRALLDVLAALVPGVHLWVTHPAQDSPETWALWADDDTARTRHEDFLALSSPEVLAQVRARAIELISFRQHLETRLGTQPDE
ncbi:MAG TPA: ChbG/HpnK family deacetylase [Gemmataceae bacterium]|nr:ChbG/HpnK family deacetylase [Gemmataceae bacterium]